MTVGWGLLTVTFLLCVAGWALFAGGHVGWAQFCWVLASGTAGGAVVRLIDRWHW